MEYGILVVECGGLYQVLGPASSLDEAHELIHNYLRAAVGYEDAFIAPEAFVLHRRAADGQYTIREDVWTVEIQ
jgi:hypothetical protein